MRPIECGCGCRETIPVLERQIAALQSLVTELQAKLAERKDGVPRAARWTRKPSADQTP